jgi:hypothetical protein
LFVHRVESPCAWVDCDVGGGRAPQVPLDHAAQRGPAHVVIVVPHGKRLGVLAGQGVVAVPSVAHHGHETGVGQAGQAQFDVNDG